MSQKYLCYPMFNFDIGNLPFLSYFLDHLKKELTNFINLYKNPLLVLSNISIEYVFYISLKFAPFQNYFFFILNSLSFDDVSLGVDL
jgi:hypothetical protein